MESLVLYGRSLLVIHFEYRSVVQAYLNLRKTLLWFKHCHFEFSSLLFYFNFILLHQSHPSIASTFIPPTSKRLNLFACVLCEKSQDWFQSYTCWLVLTQQLFPGLQDDVTGNPCAQCGGRKKCPPSEGVNPRKREEGSCVEKENRCPLQEGHRRRQWHPIPVLLPGKSHGRRSLVGGSPWGREGSDMTERLHFHFSLSCIGEGNGNPFQCSCLENRRGGGAWWAAVYGVAQSWTQLMRLSSSSNSRRKDMEAQVRMEKLRRWRGTPCCPPWKGLRPTPVEKGQGWALPRSPDLHSNHSPSCSDGRHLTDCLTGGPKGWSSQSGVWAESDFLCSRHCSHVSYGTGLQLQLWQSYSSFKTQLDSHHLR